MKKLIFVISPDTHFLDLAGPDQVFFEAIYFGAPFQLLYSTYAEEAFTSSGLRFAKLLHFTDTQPKQGDYIILPGMDFRPILNDPGFVPPAFYEWLIQAYADGVYISSVCSGAFLLAKSGLLDGKVCTTHWKYTRRLQDEFPAARVQENVLFTEKDGIFTSAGIASGVDMALHIVEKELGSYIAHKVAREIVVYIRRSGDAEQQSAFLDFRCHIHTGVHAVQDWLHDNLDQKTNLSQLADIAHMSRRNFTRIFRKETGISVGDYITHLRRAKLKELSNNPDLSRQQMMQMVGVESVRHLSRLMRIA